MLTFSDNLPVDKMVICLFKWISFLLIGLIWGLRSHKIKRIMFNNSCAAIDLISMVFSFNVLYVKYWEFKNLTSLLPDIFGYSKFFQILGNWWYSVCILHYLVNFPSAYSNAWRFWHQKHMNSHIKWENLDIRQFHINSGQNLQSSKFGWDEVCHQMSLKNKNKTKITSLSFQGFGNL